MKGLVKPHPFIGLLILNVINRFIFGHGVVIYYVLVWLIGISLAKIKGDKRAQGVV